MSTTAIIFTIIGWIITIGIAICTVILNAKDTNKKIASLEESTAKQVESVKELAKIQIETAQIQINKELWEARSRFLQADKKQVELAKNDHTFQMASDIGTMLREQHVKNVELSSESEFQQKYAHVLEQFQSRLSELSKEIGGV